MDLQDASQTKPDIMLHDPTRSEIDVAIATAKRFPRSIAKFRTDAMTMATMDQETASSCFYKLPRGGKSIEGPSVRLAEIAANAFGNLRFGARIIAENDRFITAQGIAHDLEKNVYSTIEVKRKITDRNGVRFNDDMIVVASNAACSIALRNAIFKAIPFTYVKVVYEKAKEVAIGTQQSLGSRREQMVSAFGKMGISIDRLLAYLEKSSIEDVGLADIEELIGVFNGIKDGDTDIDEVFPPIRKDAALAGSAQAPAPNAAPATPQASAKTDPPTTLQEFNMLFAQVKKEKGKEVAEGIMEKHGQKGAFPSKIPGETVRAMIDDLNAILKAA